MSFSSSEGKQSILAIGRSNGQLSLRSISEPKDRFVVNHANAVTCVSFKPIVTQRKINLDGTCHNHEDLLVGDACGFIYYYSIKWSQSKDGSKGFIVLMAKICLHRQQVCGLAWSPDGDFFASGGNDNLSFLFEARDILRRDNAPLRPKILLPKTLQYISHPDQPAAISRSGSRPETSRKQWSEATEIRHETQDSQLNQILHPCRVGYVPGTKVLLVGPGRQMHTFEHTAAIKAIAFCPWQRGLVATGGGVNDRTIRFWHVYSGACLAVIAVHAQVTSLIWSRSRREIAATFGFAQPEHPFRIAVFSWPECRQIVSIPWAKSEHRALYAIAYPGGPNESENGKNGRNNEREGGTWWARTKEEGCIVVAGSDGSVRFHEVWCESEDLKSGPVGSGIGANGIFGESQILEGLNNPDASLSARADMVIR